VSTDDRLKRYQGLHAFLSAMNGQEKKGRGKGHGFSGNVEDHPSRNLVCAEKQLTPTQPGKFRTARYEAGRN